MPKNKFALSRKHEYLINKLCEIPSIDDIKKINDIPSVNDESDTPNLDRLEREDNETR